MYFEPFYSRFPEVAKRETRSLMILNDEVIPEGEYALIDSYCSQPNCDCRRVYLNVIDMAGRESLATISYGWEDIAFYRKWIEYGDKSQADLLKGPILNPSSPQTEIAPALLKHVELTLEDSSYLHRIMQHYVMFKEIIDQEPHENLLPSTVTPRPQRTPKLVKRNDPCPCGSGKKYKHCCK